MLQCVAVCCSVLQCEFHAGYHCRILYAGVLQCVALQCVLVRCSVLYSKYLAGYRCRILNAGVLQCVTLRCSVLQSYMQVT